MLNSDVMSHFSVNPLQCSSQLYPNQIINLENVLLQDLHCCEQPVAQTSRVGTSSTVIYLQHLPFLGRWEGGSRGVPHISYAVNLLVTRKNEKGLYASQYSAGDCVHRTSFDTMASIQVCFPYLFFFWTGISQFMA